MNYQKTYMLLAFNLPTAMFANSNAIVSSYEFNRKLQFKTYKKTKHVLRSIKKGDLDQLTRFIYLQEDLCCL